MGSLNLRLFTLNSSLHFSNMYSTMPTMATCSVVFIIMLKVNIAEHFPMTQESCSAALETAGTIEYRNDKHFND